MGYTAYMVNALKLKERRKLSPAKLKKARLDAHYFNVTELARIIGIHRTAYLKWEDPNRGPKTHVDYVALDNILTLLGVRYEDITDPLLEGGTP